MRTKRKQILCACKEFKPTEPIHWVEPEQNRTPAVTVLSNFYRKEQVMMMLKNYTTSNAK